MRQQLLTNQGAIWADDEIWWRMLALPHVHETAFLDPMLATSRLTAGTLGLVQHWTSSHDHIQRIVTVVFVEGHWIPCVWSWRVSALEFQTWEHDSVDINRINLLHGLLCRALGLTMFTMSLAPVGLLDFTLVVPLRFCSCPTVSVARTFPPRQNWILLPTR